MVVVVDVLFDDIGAVAVAFIAAFEALMAVLVDDVVFVSVMVLLSMLTVLLSAVFVWPLQAATETAATAAPTIRIVRSVPEVIFLVPCG